MCPVDAAHCQSAFRTGSFAARKPIKRSRMQEALGKRSDDDQAASGALRPLWQTTFGVLQRTVGNRAMQSALAVGAADTESEHEAERVAGQVTRQSASSTQATLAATGLHRAITHAVPLDSLHRALGNRALSQLWVASYSNATPSVQRHRACDRARDNMHTGTLQKHAANSEAPNQGDDITVAPPIVEHVPITSGQPMAEVALESQQLSAHELTHIVQKTGVSEPFHSNKIHRHAICNEDGICYSEADNQSSVEQSQQDVEQNDNFAKSIRDGLPEDLTPNDSLVAVMAEAADASTGAGGGSSFAADEQLEGIQGARGSESASGSETAIVQEPELTEGVFDEAISGLIYGSMQALTPGGFAAPSPMPQSQAFEFFRGAGEFATGVVQVIGGVTGEAIGLTADATILGALVGVPINVASAAIAANGATAAAAGLWTSVNSFSVKGIDGAGKPYEVPVEHITPDNDPGMKGSPPPSPPRSTTKTYTPGEYAAMRAEEIEAEIFGQGAAQNEGGAHLGYKNKVARRLEAEAKDPVLLPEIQDALKAKAARLKAEARGDNHRGGSGKGRGRR